MCYFMKSSISLHLFFIQNILQKGYSDVEHCKYAKKKKKTPPVKSMLIRLNLIGKKDTSVKEEVFTFRAFCLHNAF